LKSTTILVSANQLEDYWTQQPSADKSGNRALIMNPYSHKSFIRIGRWA